MIYNKDETEDVFNILVAINAFAEGAMGDFSISEVDVDTALVEACVSGMRNPFPHADGVEKASAFKKVAYFMVHFIYQRPIQGVKFVNDIDEHYLFRSPLTEFDPNCVFALHFAVLLLRDVEIRLSENEKIVIRNEMALSKHSYSGFLEALNNIDVQPKEHFALLAILLEQLVYKTNEECQYLDYVFGPKGYWDDITGKKGSGYYPEIEAAE